MLLKARGVKIYNMSIKKDTKKQVAILLFYMISVFSVASQNISVSISLLKNEQWWCGVINEAHLMPFGNSAIHSFEMLGDNAGNQVQPLLISNKGRYVWSEEPFRFDFKNGRLLITGKSKIDTGTSGSTLKEAQQYVRQTYFISNKKLPDTLLFIRPQYNTWIELNYNQNQADVLKYAHAIVNNGLPPGVLMIDDTWQEDYGVWDFHPKKFPNPKAMMEELHRLGFKVMLWVCPLVSPDSKEYRELAKKDCLLKDSSTNRSYMVGWWNGFSAVLDFSNSIAANWFNYRLNYLQKEYGVDGFKFDAGDFSHYPFNSKAKQNITSNEHSRLYAEIGLQYPLNEYRACWKTGGQPLVQRLRDKEHTWEDLQKLVPGMALTGLVGYSFSCPDMIGGGEIESFWANEKNLDQDLIVRSAQCHALMPMMQFSVAPWRVLDSIHFAAVKKSVELHNKFVPVIIRLANVSAATGEPIVKSMEYVFPNQGFEKINNQFMLGDSILVAPVVIKGTVSTVQFPKLKNGKWKAENGKIYMPGTIATINSPIDRLPYFEVVK